MSILIFFLLLLSTSLSVSGQRRPTVYEVLRNYTLPRGILPKGVEDYELNRNTGVFKVYFNSTCQFAIDMYKVKYRSTISGVIARGRVIRLIGVSVKVLFFWINISGVSRDDDDLDFSVGFASEEVPARYFVDSPQCGCGFNCYHELVSSS